MQNIVQEEAETPDKQEKIERLPVLEGISKYAKDHVLLRGKPGSGKSTALIRLLLEKAQSCLKTDSANNAKIPVLVELRYWETSVFELIQAFLERHDASLILDDNTIKTLLRQGQLLLLIDGANELPSNEERQKVVKFRQQFPQTPMIFTTRVLSRGENLGIEKELEMQPLTETQMRDFVMAYLPQQGEEMLRCLQDRLRELGQTPLLLWMLCGLFQQTGMIPPNLGMVFRQFTQGYENSDALKRNVPVTTESRRWWSNLLQYLAFQMMQGNPITEYRVAIFKGEAEEILTQYLRDEQFNKPRNYAKCWLEDLLKHHLIQIGNGEKIEFRHQLLQEYYAAEYLLRQLPKISPAKLQRDYLNLLKWTEPIALMLALIDNEAQALRIVQLALDIDLMLGARLAGEVQPQFQQKAVNFILDKKFPKLLEIELLGLTRSEDVIDALIQALNNEDFYIRISALKALEKNDSNAAVNTLIHALNHQDFWVRSSVVEASGKIRSDAAVKLLIQALNHQDLYIRRKAVKFLEKIDLETINSSVLVEPLIQALNDKDSLVCRKSVEFLEKIGSDAAVNALIQALNQQESDIHSSVVKALGEIGSDDAVRAAYTAESTAVYDLTQTLKNEDPLVRLHAVNELRIIGSYAAVKPLIKASNDKCLGVRKRAAEALREIRGDAAGDNLTRGKTGSDTAVEPLIRALKNEDLNVRRRAAELLGKIGSDAVVDALTQTLKNKYPYVRLWAIYALGKIGSDAAVNALIKALNDENSSVFSTAVEFLKKIDLEKIDSDVAVVTLIQALNQPDSSIRSKAAKFLGKIGSNAAVKPLTQALNDKNSSVRSMAIEALREIGSDDAVKSLTQALNNKDPDVSRSVLDTLGKIGSDIPIKPLIQALNHQDFVVCSRAVEALEKIDSDMAVKLLNQVLNHQDSRISCRAIEVLGKIGSDTAVELLIQALNHQDFVVRSRAVEVLEKIKIIGSDKLAIMWKIILNGKTESIDIILKIQDRCQFYNHDIFYSPPVEENEQSDYSATSTTHNYYGSVGIVQTGDTTIQGNQTGIQNNQNKE